MTGDSKQNPQARSQGWFLPGKGCFVVVAVVESIKYQLKLKEVTLTGRFKHLLRILSSSKSWSERSYPGNT